MAIMDLLIWLSLGAALGVVGGLFGIGGGLMAIPLLGLLGGLDQQSAQGTALVMVLPTVLIAARKYHGHTRIDMRVVTVVSLSAMGFTWLGAQLALGISSGSLRRGFAGFLALIALQYIWQAYRKPPSGGPRTTSIASVPAGGLGVIAGLLGGFFGVGGGVLMAPILSGVFRLAQTAAQGMALAMVVPTASVGLLSYAMDGRVHWMMGLPMALGGILCVGPGVQLAHRVPERLLKLAFAVLLAAISAALFYSAGGADQAGQPQSSAGAVSAPSLADPVV